MTETLHPARAVGHNAHVPVAVALNRRELDRYVQRVGDRWTLQRAVLGGGRIEDLHGAGAQRERGPEFVIVLVSELFDGVPWLERVYVAGSLWDAGEMGDRAEVHCYTPAELQRKIDSMAIVRRALTHGIELI